MCLEKIALEFVQSIKDEELEFISLADHGQDTKKHKAALRILIFEQNCIINAEQHWYPYEVVELTRWSCKEGHEREFAICNIIISLSIKNGMDRSNDPNEMLNQLATEYDKLPEDIKMIVLNSLIDASGKS